MEKIRCNKIIAFREVCMASIDIKFWQLQMYNYAVYTKY